MRVAWLAIGFLCATSAAAETLYRLPWPDGMSFMFTQAPGGRITTHFTKATLHAVDIDMPPGTPVVAARSGAVEAVEAEHRSGPDAEPVTYEGNFVRVLHPDGTSATYAHLRRRGVVVAIGQAVEAGQLLGYSGSSGDVEHAHLHFVVTRTQTNASGSREQSSVPVTFYVGTPPVPFIPRVALRVKANYAGPAEAPRMASEARLVPWERPAFGPGEEARGWALLISLLASGIAGACWYWRFVTRPEGMR